MSVTQQQVLDRLSKVMSPRGVALTNADVLSAITVGDGKVFFSINVDAAEARAWESVRAGAEAAVRAIPGVTVAMIALTAERKPGATPPPAPPPHRHAHGVQHVSAHKPPQSPTSPMAKQAEIPGVAAKADRSWAAALALPITMTGSPAPAGKWAASTLAPVTESG